MDSLNLFIPRIPCINSFLQPQTLPPYKSLIPMPISYSPPKIKLTTMPLILPFMTSQIASASPPPSSDSESFHKFFEQWIADQNQLLEQLISAAESPDRNEPELRSITNRVLRHYEQYYREKSRSARRDVLSVLTPPWLSRLEDAFLWIGGWRPSTAFHLLYSKSGLQFEARLEELLRGAATGDLGDLSPSQLARVDELQRKTLREEKALTEAMAQQQDTVADSSMVALSEALGEVMRSGGELDAMEERVDSALAPKEDGLREILWRADDLRMRTLRSVIDVLTPIQAVHFLIAAAELHIWIHEWGKKRDAGAPSEAHVQDEVQPQQPLSRIISSVN